MAMKTEMQSRIKQLEVESERLANTLELVRSQRDKANATITDRDETIEELQQRVSELEAERQQFIIQLEEVKRRNDDLSISNTSQEMQIQQLRESYDEAHKEAVQLQMMLSTEKAKVENLDRLLERFGRNVTKVIDACDDFLYVAFGMEKNHVVDNLEKLSQVQRFALCIKRILS